MYIVYTYFVECLSKPITYPSIAYSTPTGNGSEKVSGEGSAAAAEWQLDRKS